MPKKTLEARGSWRAKQADAPLAFPPGKPTCPSWLGKESRAEWCRQVKLLESAGVLTGADRALLAAYCEAWGEFRELVETVKQDPADWRSRAMKNAAADRLLKLAGQFGFAPAARARIKAPAAETEERPSGFARFFAG